MGFGAAWRRSSSSKQYITYRSSSPSGTSCSRAAHSPSLVEDVHPLLRRLERRRPPPPPAAAADPSSSSAAMAAARWEIGPVAECGGIPFCSCVAGLSIVVGDGDGLVNESIDASNGQRDAIKWAYVYIYTG